MVVAVLVAAVLSDIPATSDEHQREEAHPLVSRKSPSNSTKPMPPLFVPPSPSNIPHPVPVDETLITTGNDLVYRHFLDYPQKLQIIMPGNEFGAYGNITEWEVYAGRDCVLSAQILRPAPVPELLKHNPSTVHAYTVVGHNILYIDRLGYRQFAIEKSDQISVQPGDVIGFYTSDPGCISWSEGGTYPVHHRFGAPTHLDIKAFDGILTAGDGLLRTYSIACSGSFRPNVALAAQPRVSPSASPSTSPSLEVVTSTTPSLTPIYSSTPSMSASPSPSWTLSPSPSPSYTPSASIGTIVCAKGVEEVCRIPETMKLCGWEAASCIAALTALKASMPVHLTTDMYQLMLPRNFTWNEPAPLRASAVHMRNATRRA